VKIIGYGKDETIILQATKDEVAHFKGEYSGYSKKFDIGDTFDVHKMYENASATLNSYKEIKANFEKVQKETTKLLTLMKGGE
jgi:hypothetical protein